MLKKPLIELSNRQLIYKTLETERIFTKLRFILGLLCCGNYYRTFEEKIIITDIFVDPDDISIIQVTGGYISDLAIERNNAGEVLDINTYDIPLRYLSMKRQDIRKELHIKDNDTIAEYDE